MEAVAGPPTSSAAAALVTETTSIAGREGFTSATLRIGLLAMRLSRSDDRGRCSPSGLESVF